MATNATNYFQSSLLAQEMEDIWTGAVRFNDGQNLTEIQKAQARENIGAVAFGSNLKILGHFDSVTELQASAQQKVGDAYSVGTVTPYNLYIFDGVRHEWMDYGQIRAADITARYVENQGIAVSGWTQDDTVFTDYHFKARITFEGATSDDFPIVAFDAAEASSGNFAPLCFAWNGYLEIFAKAVPNGAINIPVATVIVNGGNGKGITNANGGLIAGSITTDKIADNAVTETKIADGAVSAHFTATIGTEWTGDAAPYTQDVAITGMTADDKPVVGVVYSDTFETAEAQKEAWSFVYRIKTDADKITVYAADKTETEIPIQLMCVRK